jgi:hypothetical protein
MLASRGETVGLDPVHAHDVDVDDQDLTDVASIVCFYHPEEV